MDMGTISAAISGFNAALKLAKEAIAARDQRLMEKAESELTKELLQITQAALALGNENTAIMQRNRDLEEQRSQAERVCERSVRVKKTCIGRAEAASVIEQRQVYGRRFSCVSVQTA